MADTGEEEIVNPGLETIPVLPVDYPLFDWADWPESRAALQPGVATSRFQKDAWNAIVNALGDALELAGVDAGLKFPLDNSLMTAPYSRFDSVYFNGVSLYIEKFTPFSWPWAVDPSFRGYIGSKRFSGTTIEYDETGAFIRIRQGNEVYPEYILELARRVNLLLELMRGTADTVESTVSHPAQLLIQSKGAVSRMGAGMGREHIARTLIGNITLEDFSGIGSGASYLAASLAKASMEKVAGGGITQWLPFYSNIALSGRAARDEQVPRISAQWLAASAVAAEAAFINPSYTQAEELSKSQGAAKIAQLPPMGTSGQQLSTSAAAVAAETRNNLKETSAQQQSAIDLQIGIMSIIPRFVVTEPKSRTSHQLEILLTRMVGVLMHSDLSMLLSGGVSEERVRDILMALNGDPVPMLGQGRMDTPEALMLRMDSRLLSRTSLTSWLFDSPGAFLFDTGIWTANHRTERPEESVLWALNGLLRTVRPKAEPPTARLLQTIRTDVFDASGRLEQPQSGKLEALLMLLGTANTKAYRFHEALLKWLEWLIVGAGARLEHPTAVELLWGDRSLCLAGGAPEDPTAIGLLLNPIHPLTAWGNIKNPNELYMLAFLRLFGTTDAAVQEPTIACLFLSPKRLSVAAGRLEEPAGCFLQIVLRLLGYTGASIEAPALTRLWQIQRGRFHLSGRLQNPEELFLFWVERHRFRGGGRLDGPRECLMQSDLAGLHDGSGRMQRPEELWLFSRNWLFNIGQPRQDVPRALRGRTVVPLWGKGIPRQDVPREVLQWMVDMDFPGFASARLEEPEERYLYSPVIFIKAGSPRQDIPRAFLLRVAAWEIEGFGQGRVQAPNVLRLLTRIIQRAATSASTDRPREHYLKAIVASCIPAFPARQNPSRFFLNSISDTVSAVYPRLQLPDGQLLAAIAGTVSRTEGEIMVPWGYRGGTSWDAAVESIPQLQGPERIQLYVDARLGTVAHTARLRRRATRGITELMSAGSMSADLMAPETIRMLSESLLVTVAHAGLLNRKAVQTSGYLAELIGGFLTAELSEAELLLMATSAGLYTVAGSGIARVTSIGGGVLQMEIDAGMGGYTIRIVSTRGGITIELPDIYAAPDTAAAIHGAGRQIELEINVRLGGISAKYAKVLMWSAVPAPEMIAGGGEEAVRDILGVVAIEGPELMARGGISGTSAGRGGTEFSLVSVGGGSVRSADGLWSDPVQSGSDLYITCVQQSWNDGNELYVDLDVFYESVQTGSDLYIRSADYVWTDGDSANIDTEFFLEPVQEGSDLYIRQDIFGGE